MALLRSVGAARVSGRDVQDELAAGVEGFAAGVCAPGLGERENLLDFDADRARVDEFGLARQGAQLASSDSMIFCANASRLCTT
jgi:hypothetical protein